VYAATLGVAGANNCFSSPNCVGYHIGIHLEKSNSVINSDKDTNTGSTVPDGVSALDGCAVDSKGILAADLLADLCYDLSNI